MEVQLKSRTFNNCDACNWVWSFSLAFMPQFLHCGYIRQVKSEEEKGDGKGSRGCTACVSRQSISHWHIDWMLQRTEPWSPDAMPALAQLTGWLDDSVDRTKERTEVVWQQFKAFSKRNIDRACARFGGGRLRGVWQNFSLVARCPCCRCQGISLVNFPGSLLRKGAAHS